MNNVKVNIIIPAYNAGAFIKDCVDSVFSQTFSDWHIILVNDGSTDNTLDIISQYPTEKMTVISQKNQGVSAARNNGFLVSSGKYVVFLDADDMLTPRFLELRLKFLEAHPEYGYCSSDMHKFTTDPEKPISFHQGCADDPVKEILLYSPKHDTAPSNYLFRRETLAKNKLLFNRLLSSTADRLFLLELNEFSEGWYVGGAPLLYRVHEKSMSNKLTETLINDNIQYYKLLSINKFIPSRLKRKALFYKYSILGFSYLKIRNKKGIRYLISGILISPDYFILGINSRFLSLISGKKK